MDLMDDKARCYYLESAVWNGDLKMIREFEHRFGRSYLKEQQDRHELLNLAVRLNQTEILKLLLGHECKEKELYSVPGFLLNIAIARGNEEIAKLLIDSETSVNSKGWNDFTHLHDAVFYDRFQIADYLLQNGESSYSTCTSYNYSSSRMGYVLLHLAAEKGNVDMVKFLLKKGPPTIVNRKTDNGLNSLHIAVKNRHPATANILLEYGADVNSTNNNELTPLHFAVKSPCSLDFSETGGASTHNNVNSHFGLMSDKVQNIDEFEEEQQRENLVKLLINYGCNVNVKDILLKSPLHYAIENENLNNITLLLENKADVKKCFEPLHLAVTKRYKKAVELLLAHNADVHLTDKIGKTALHLIASDFEKNEPFNMFSPYCDRNKSESNSADSEENEEIAKLLLIHGAVVDAKTNDGSTPLHLAVDGGYVRIVKLLLENGANVNLKSRHDCTTPLHIAARNGHVEVMKILIDSKADVNASKLCGTTPLIEATIGGNQEAVKLLFQHGAEVNCHSENDYYAMSPVQISVIHGCVGIIELLLRHNADVNAKGFLCVTALDLAIQNGDEQIVELLLQHNADVYKCSNGGTALHTAACLDNVNILRMILKSKPEMDVNSKDRLGRTPFYLATKHRNMSIINFLKYFYNADVNSISNDGTTPLHVAVRQANVELVETLLKFSANVNVISNKGKTPLDLSLRCVTVTQANYSYLAAYEQTAKNLTKHIFKMKASNFYVSEGNFESIYRHNKARQFGEECEREIRNMMGKKLIDGSGISIFDIFTKNVHHLAMCTLHNEETVQCLKSNQPDFKTEFPVYSSMLESQLSDAMERKELLEKSDVIFYNFLPVALYDCVSKISGYLSNDNLKDLIYACAPK